MERRLMELIKRVDIRAMRHQEIERGIVAVPACGKMNGFVAIGGARVHGRTMGEERFYHIDVTAFGGKVDRRVTIVLHIRRMRCAGNICAMIEQDMHDGIVSRFTRDIERSHVVGGAGMINVGF